MRTVFNYRKALREPKKIQQITENFSLPFAIELIPAINFFIFMLITFGIGYIIRMGFPHAFTNTWFIYLVGIPLALTMFVTKIKPEGKNIYLFFWDIAVYFVRIKIPQKKFCGDKEIEWMDESNIKFRKCVKVVGKANVDTKNTHENDERKFVVNENGRRVCVLPNKEPVYPDAK